MIYYKNGFYDTEIHAVIPPDAVKITTKQHRELLTAQTRGCRIETGADGIPVAVEPAPPTLEKLKEQASATLWSNYKKYQQRYVDAEDLTLATVCAAQGSTKGAAVQRWVMELWAQYYTIKDAVDAAANTDALAAIDLTAETFGAVPHTIRELNAEAAAAATQKGANN